MTSVPHFSFPFRWAGGRAVVVEQDTSEEIEQGVRVLMASHVGERLEVPSFGIDDPTFHLSADEEAIRTAASRWDERVRVALLETPDEAHAMIRHLLVQVSERED